jgi:hypothetical protein
MLAAARVTLKQHRFEVTVAALAAIAAAALGLSIAIRVDGLHVSQACLDQVRGSQDGSGIGEGCLSLVRAGTPILGETYLTGEGSLPASVMGALPFLLGLLGGVPIVARELEAGTAQTAWSLNGSRTRWLARQVAPIAVVLGAAMILAALVAIPVGDIWVHWGQGGAASLIGLHGLLAVVRAFGAFGVGLAVGALLGRTLPAFLFGAVLTFALLFAAGSFHDAWLRSLPPTVIAEYSPETGEYNGIPGSVPTGWAWVTPDGDLISADAARQLASEAGVPPPDPNDVQDTPAGVWLEEHGYVELPIGVTDKLAMGWAPCDGLIFGLVGLVSFGATIVLVNRRRPT